MKLFSMTAMSANVPYVWIFLNNIILHFFILSLIKLHLEYIYLHVLYPDYNYEHLNYSGTPLIRTTDNGKPGLSTNIYVKWNRYYTKCFFYPAIRYPDPNSEFQFPAVQNTHHCVPQLKPGSQQLKVSGVLSTLG